jgi:predicted lipoprotein with Yx(FWY)xxD motif
MKAKFFSTTGLVALLTGLCAAGATAADQRATESTATRGKPATWVKAKQTEFGRIIVTGASRTIYLFDREERPRSECYGACAAAWPPVLARGGPLAGAGVQEELLGTTTRRNGKRQVTYGGHPLYLYAPEAPNQITCQNVFEFGGLWLIVRPSGRPVR